jgi:hypothetical protein
MEMSQQNLDSAVHTCATQFIIQIGQIEIHSTHVPLNVQSYC